MTFHRVLATCIAGAALAPIGGCSLAPPYERPSTPAPAVFKEAPAADSTWFPAAPADELDRGHWWTLFNDPVLSGLVEQVEVSNQNVASAVAAYAQAEALVREQRAALFPSLALNGSATRTGGRGAQQRSGNNSISRSGRAGSRTSGASFVSPSRAPKRVRRRARPTSRRRGFRRRRRSQPITSRCARRTTKSGC
jgi:outer membrane protein TolC